MLQLRQVPGCVELDEGTGVVRVNRSVLPRVARNIVFGRGRAAQAVAQAVRTLTGGQEYPGSVLAVVGRNASRAPAAARVLETLRASLGGRATLPILEVDRHADHAAIQAGLSTIRRSGARLVLAVGGGTVLDVAKAVAALAGQEGGEDIAAFQLGLRQVDLARCLPWVAVPTTAGTGSESTDNAVIELGEEKKSIRGIPAPQLIAADPALTDSLPLRPTLTAAADALAQSLEVLINAAASAAVQEVALAGFTVLADALARLERRLSSHTGTPAAPAVAAAGTGQPAPPGSGWIDETVRDTLCWGSLLMGLAFAHARLGLPHALVHFCERFGLPHGHMVALLLPAGLAVQSRDPQTASRLARAAQALRGLQAASPAGRGPAPAGPGEGEAERPEDPNFPGEDRQAQWLIRQVRKQLSRLFALVDMAESLRQAGLTQADLRWIAEHEMANRPAYGIPARPATQEELLEVLEAAWS